jgi:hypothetical protein
LITAVALAAYVYVSTPGGQLWRMQRGGRYQCQPGLEGVIEPDRARILEWARGRRVASSAWEYRLTFHCRLDAAKYLVVMSDAPRLDEGLYLFDLHTALDSAMQPILGGAHGVRGIVLDKSNEPYVFLETHGLSHGISWTQYTVLNLRSLSPVFLYDGGQDGEGGGCNRHEFLDLKRATLKVSAGLRDRDQDGYTDIVIEAEEQDCKMNAVVQVIKVFFARADGFKASP